MLGGVRRLAPLLVALVVAACSDGSASSQPSHGQDAGDDAASDANMGDASEAGTDAGDPLLDAKCTPTFTLQLEDTGPKGQIFTDAILEPEAFVQDVGRTVCRILYRKPEEVRDANHLTLIIRDDPDYPGWKSGDVGDITVMISTGHLADVQAKGGDVTQEIRGILLHEMTHMYQNDDKALGEGTYAQLGNVIEGIADFVRIRAGYPPAGAVPSKSGAWDDAGYWKPAFFLLWIDHQYADFLYRLNLSMTAGDGVAWTPDSITDLTGKSVSDLWTGYQGAACCAGKTQTCCY
jgi:hypothetical protein